MSKKFLHLPIEQKIPLTKKSIQQELEINEGGYPKHVSMNTEYMLEIFEYVEELEAERHHFEKLSIGYRQALQQIHDTASNESVDEFMSYGYVAKQALEEK